MYRVFVRQNASYNKINDEKMVAEPTMHFIKTVNYQQQKIME